MTVRLWAATKIVLICLLVAMMGIVIIPAYFLRAEGLRTGAIRTMLRGINLILRVRVQVQGEASTHTPVIYVANHISYLDIPVLGCLLGASFTPKAELASWPVLGWLARLNRPVFIDRRAAAAERDRDAIAQRIDLVGKVIIFPEATTGLGRDVLRFRSSFFSLAEGRSEEQPIDVQPITLSVLDRNGKVFDTDTEQSLYAWVSEEPLHRVLWRYLQAPPCTMAVHFHPVIRCGTGVDRKVLAARCQEIIRDELLSIQAHRPLSRT